MLIAPAFLLFGVFEIFVTKTYDGVRSANELISAASPMLLVAVIFYIIKKRSLRFKEVQIIYTNEEFQEAVKRTANEYKWRIDRNNKKYFRAYRPSNWTGSWGEMITIIREKDRLLLNSICDPNTIGSITSFGWNKRNVDTFLKNLNDVKEGVLVQERIEKPEKEWSFKRIVIRIFAYPFCLLLIGFGFYAIINPVNMTTPFAGLGGMAIAVVYIYSDIKMIMK